MPECLNTVTDFSRVREAVCVSTRKIMDACRDQDCMECVRVYLTTESQTLLDSASSVRPRCAELLWAGVTVEPAAYAAGCYYIDIQFFYKIVCDVTIGAARPAMVYGVAMHSKRVLLYGGEGSAKRFSSATGPVCGKLPLAVVEAVDPVFLSACIQEGSGGEVSCPLVTLPGPVKAAFDEELSLTDGGRCLVVTLGQFSMVRLERDTQLLIPSYDYCIPGKACCEDDRCRPEDPCEAFSRMMFPVGAFFPVGERAEVCPPVPCGCGGNAPCGEEPAADCGDCHSDARPGAGRRR